LLTLSLVWGLFIVQNTPHFLWSVDSVCVG
jgi:hypothetical protein